MQHGGGGGVTYIHYTYVHYLHQMMHSKVMMMTMMHSKADKKNR